MLFRSLPEIYKDVVGYDLDAGPGGPAVGKDPLQAPVEGANNIGTQQKVVDPACTFCEGGSVSRGLNQVPGINAVAGMHDVFQVNLGTGLARDIFNIPGMPVAAALTYGGFLGVLLTVLTPQQIIFYSTSPAFRYDRRRDQ